jgi:hypothetical protein
MLKILAYANTDRIFSILINNLESRCDLSVVASIKASIKAFTEDTSFQHSGICSKI